MTADFQTLLLRTRAGDSSASAELIPLVYQELHKIASAYLRRERPGHTLQPTALVNEVYLRLMAGKPAEFEDRIHFLGIAARLMRQILADHARRKGAAKRGAAKLRLDTRDAMLALDSDRAVTALDDALTALAQRDAEQARFVEMRFFGGMTAEEIAASSHDSVHRVRHRLRVALAWLHREVNGPAAT